MNEFEASVIINRPMPEVWEYLNGNENDLVWQSSAIERGTTGEGPIGKGSTYSNVDRFLGRHIETQWEITELHEYLRCDRTLKSPFDIEVEYRLEPAGSATRFTMRMITETGLGGIFGKLADPVVLRIARREWQHNLDKLKDILEAGAD